LSGDKKFAEKIRKKFFSTFRADHNGQFQDIVEFT